MSRVGALIKKRRGSDSDAHVAEILGVSQTTVSRWRRGVRRPEPENFPALAAWLGIQVEFLAALVEVDNKVAGIKRVGKHAEQDRQLAQMDDTIRTLKKQVRELSTQVEIVVLALQRLSERVPPPSVSSAARRSSK